MVLIAQPELLPALEQAARTEAAEVITVSDREPLRALEVISTRRPDIIALDHLFAATPRGAALINRIRADPSLLHAEIRIMSTDVTPVSASPVDPAAVTPGKTPSGGAVPPQPLDQRGTRVAQRFQIAGEVGVLVDGNQAMLVDLSVNGAQVVSVTVLRPNQRVRVTLSDEHGSIRCAAVIAWAAFEMPSKTGPHYRAGLEFFNADPNAIDAYCARHRED
jgi:hypothetical protein